MRYRPGGYHPVKLGDCFSTLPASAASSISPRYRILHKLGHGSFATVWLARDLLPPGRFVALKIIISDFPAGNEARIFKFFADHSAVNIEGSQHVLSLLDSFQIEGPNGVHQVLVTEVVASLGELTDYPVCRKFQNMFIYQALQGVSYLHSQGIAHGDLHIGNFGCSLPGLNEYTQSDLLDHFGNPQCLPTLTVNPEDQTASLPPYLIPALSMAEYLAKANPPLPIESEPPLLKILDFGSAFQQGEARPPRHTAITVIPPEILFPMIALGDEDPNWDVRSDVWSLACTIYKLLTRFEFFNGASPSLLIRLMARIVGYVPPLWALYWASDKYTQHEAAQASAKWMAEKPILMQCGKSEQEADRVIDLLRSMLVLDPAERPSIRQVMETHRWLEPSTNSGV